jgi:predicted cupin superfamily sugar epimerase
LDDDRPGQDDLSGGGFDAEDIIDRLSLRPHPEGGLFRETYRHAAGDGGRGALTVIYYVLRAGERSAWHRIDAVEVWHHYAGAPLRLSLSEDGLSVRSVTLGDDLRSGQQPHAVVPDQVWQSAESLGGWTLVGCTVAPAFLFSGFELAPPDWSPG